MKVNAICMVKNEADVIAEVIENALAFCDNIYVFDNGSTDGTSEIIDSFVAKDSRVTLAERSGEPFKNQLRNRVYNRYHHQFSQDDWWYILDADELIKKDPRPLLNEASDKGKDSMRVWQAQFYFTDKDMEVYDTEDKTLPTSERRRHYRINWREARFFKNDPMRAWPETESGRVPSFRGHFYYKSPICCHYAQRTPEQIKQRIEMRQKSKVGFVHVKQENALENNTWLKQADTLFYYNNDGEFNFPLSDRISYFAREVKFWFEWRAKSVNRYARILFNKVEV